MYKVLIADDEEIIRRGIAHFLKKDPDIQVVAQAEDGEWPWNRRWNITGSALCRHQHAVFKRPGFY